MQSKQQYSYTDYEEPVASLGGGRPGWHGLELIFFVAEFTKNSR